MFFRGLINPPETLLALFLLWELYYGCVKTQQSLEKKQVELNQAYVNDIRTIREDIQGVKDNLKDQLESQSQQKPQKAKKEKRFNVPDWILIAD